MAHIHKTKTGRTRTIPLRESLRQVLLDLTSTSDRVFPLEGSYVNRLLKRYLIAADVSERFNIHSLRHTFVTLLVEATHDLASVKALAGHANIATTQIYAQPSADHQRQLLEQLPF